MIGGHHDHGVAEIGRAFDFVDQRGDVLLAAGHRAQRAVFLVLPGVAFLAAAGGDKTVRVMGIDGQGKQRERLALFGQLDKLAVHHVQHAVVVPAPVVFVARIGDLIAQLFETVNVVEAVGFQEGVFTGERQLGALIERVAVAGGLQHVAQADVLRVEGGDRAGGVAVEGREQRNAAL